MPKNRVSNKSSFMKKSCKSVINLRNVVILIFSLFTFSSCFLESENPLSKIEDGYTDNELTGLWKSVEDTTNDDTSFLLVLKSENGVYQFTVFENNFALENDGTYNCFITKIDNNKFLNIKAFKNKFGLGDNEYNKNYFFIYYKIKKDFLKFNFINDSYITKAIENNQIKGVVKKSDNFSSPVITDETEQIYDFFKKTDLNKLIDKKELVFRKVRLK